MKHVNNRQTYRRRILLEIVLVLGLAAVVYSISSLFSLADQFVIWARQYEQSSDVDELPIALLASLLATIWFTKRRLDETRFLIQQNNELLHRVISIQESERKKIAQDLHDELGQYLNAIKVLAHGSLQSSATLQTNEKIIANADHAYQITRDIICNLRPVALDELGLSAALESLIDSWRVAHGSGCNFVIEINGEIDHLPESKNIALYRCVQEALNNIAKHAQANDVTITINADSNKVITTLKDNGKGFNPSKVSNSHGLLGMTERMRAVGGNIYLKSAPKSGTSICFEMFA